MLTRLARHGIGWVALLAILLVFGPAMAAVLTCPSGQLGDDQTGTTLPSTNVVQPGAVMSIAFQSVLVSGTSNSVQLEQCCTDSCGVSGNWAIHTAAATLNSTTPSRVINVSDPACQYRYFIVSSTGSGTDDFFFRCGAEVR